MSASRQKKLRQEQGAAANETKRRAVSKEEKSAKRLKVWSVVFYVIIGLMIVGVICAAVLNSGLLHRTLTAVTVGNHKLTPAELNYYYMDAIQGNYISYMVDNTKPLDKQAYTGSDATDGMTWADYVLDIAVQTARNTYAIYDEAIANGYTLPQEEQEELDTAINNMDAYASIYGFSSASALLRANYGVGCNVSTYRHYLEVQSLAQSYYNKYVDDLTYTQEEIDAEAAENPTDYTSYTFRYHLVKTADYYETDAEEHTDEETEAAKAAAKEVADKLAADTKGNEELFKSSVAALTAPEPTETTDPAEPEETTAPDEDVSIGTDDGGEAEPAEEAPDTTLNENVLKSRIPTDLQEWITDAGRTAGETTTVETSTGYYVAMYLSSDDNAEKPTVNVRHILISTSDDVTAEAAKAKIEEIKAQYEEDPTEDHFAELANENSSDTGSNTKGGLYENVAPGQMVEEFNDWCFEAGRKTGDVGIVETTYGCHLIYFVGEGEYSYRDYMVVNKLKEADTEAWYTAATEALTTDNKLAIGLVNTGVTVKAPSTGSGN